MTKKAMKGGLTINMMVATTTGKVKVLTVKAMVNKAYVSCVEIPWLLQQVLSCTHPLLASKPDTAV